MRYAKTERGPLFSDAWPKTVSISDILRKAGGMQSPYTAYSPVSWYNREESHSGQLYHLYKAVLSLCPEYDTSLRYFSTQVNF